MGPQPYQTAEAVVEALDGAAVYETIVFNSGDDLDGDGFTDPVDNCPFTANADQSDDGGFASTAPNGHGNACECGDANGSGRVQPASTPEFGKGGIPLVPDLQLIREHLVGMHADDPSIEKLCSVNGDTACDAADAVVLDRALQGLSANPVPRCDAAVD
ncbi:MAG: thrombospondin type 3 repeat-containing protein [Deltaproteobacteria bacterium]|nr:thrombospondin type 3 repeat-containing protein [Deltaproteobacteria bacterium]